MVTFNLFSLDKTKKYSLNEFNALATEPSGLGNNFAISYKETAEKKYLTNIKPDFEPIKMKIYFNTDGTDGYMNYKKLMAFLGYCGGGAFYFEYNDGITKKVCDVVLTTAPKSEISADGIFAEDFVFDRLDYWYEEIEQIFALKAVNNTAVAYPLSFPLRFNGKVFTNKFTTINEFYKDAPVIVRITGKILNNIIIYVKSISTGIVVGEVALSCNSIVGTTIIIDAANKKISVDSGETITNGYGLTDKTKQSFLYLPHGEYEIGSNIRQDDAGEIALSIKRYLLD